MKTIKELISLKGKKAVVTGSNGWIGQEIAVTIAELGGDLVLVDRPGTRYDNLLHTLHDNFNVKIDCIDCDLEDNESRKKLITDILKLPGSIDILINNAAFGGMSKLDGWIGEFNQQTVETWRRAIEVNLTAAFDLSKELEFKLKQNNNGVIINIASIYGILGPDHSLYEGTNMGNPAAYAASKGGLIQLTRWMSTTLAPSIRVNTVSPGGVFRNQPEEFVKRYISKVPLKRMGTEEDFKGIIAYLSSDLSLYVTGQNFIVDGGWTAW
jgi:NAD(P)-dependent dehydrogenase (short-subunit alcohol dehydrogenase family)